jgi:predicted anti-sigma-YlaC factor YlaD
MMKYLMINCKEATFLMAKKEEGKIAFLERVRLGIHTSMCSICRKFEKQTSRIKKESKHIHAEEELPALSKEKMKKIFEEHSS